MTTPTAAAKVTCDQCVKGVLGPEPRITARTPRVIEEKQRTEGYLRWKAQGDSRNAWVSKANRRMKTGEFDRRVVAADVGSIGVKIWLDCGHEHERADHILSGDSNWVERSLAKLRKAGVPSKAEADSRNGSKPTKPPKARRQTAPKRAAESGAAPRSRKGAGDRPSSKPEPRAHVSRGIRNAVHTFACQICGRAFTAPRADALFCSGACRQKNYRRSR